MLPALAKIAKASIKPLPAYEPKTREAQAIKLLFEALGEVKEFSIVKVFGVTATEIYKAIDEHENLRKPFSEWIEKVKSL